MWTLDPPDITAEEAFRACISRVRSHELKSRLENVIPDIEEAAEEYDECAEAAELHLIQPSEMVGENVTRDEMIRVYTGRMANGSSPGRPYYDSIKALAENEICPLCGHRQVKTLDHVLAKAHFPIFAVTPINLVPACTDCNQAKANSLPQAAEEVFLHPYYDDIDDDVWLRARIVERFPAAALFEASPPNQWPDVLAARLENQFCRLGLARLYSREAAQEISSIRYSLQELLESGGPDLVLKHLQQEQRSRRAAQRNSWRTALYTAMCDSDWFCDGGFRMP